MLTGLLRDWLIKRFSAPEYLTDPDLRGAIWHEDPPTGILIETQHRWRPELVEKRPAVILKRNAMQRLALGIGDRLRTDERGQVRYCAAWVGSHTAFCINGTGAATEILTAEVVAHLSMYAPALRYQLGLMDLAVVEVGEVAELEEAKEHFVAPVTVGWAYTQDWFLELESLKLRTVALQTALHC